MQPNNPIQAWIPPQIDETASIQTKSYQEIVLSKQLKQEGFDKGYQEGLIKGEHEYERQIGQVKQIIYELSKIKVDLIHDAEYVLSDIAMMVAKKVIDHELSINKMVIEKVLKEMLSKIPDMNESIKIKVHPDDLEIIKKITTNGTDKEVDISIDPSLSIGSIKLKSDFTKFEYNIDDIFNAVVKKVSS